jgi:hypothetical protein
MYQPSIFEQSRSPAFANQDFAFLKSREQIEVIQFDDVTLTVGGEELVMMVPGCPRARAVFKFYKAVFFKRAVGKTKDRISAQIHFDGFIGNYPTTETELTAQLVNEFQVVAHKSHQRSQLAPLRKAQQRGSHAWVTNALLGITEPFDATPRLSLRSRSVRCEAFGIASKEHPTLFE